MKRVIILIGLIFFFSFTYWYLWGHGFSDIDWEGVFLLPFLLIVAPAFFIGFILGCIGTKRNVSKMLLWTHGIGLAVVLFFNLHAFYFRIFPDYSAYNEQSNEQYTKTFGDKKDSLISLALNELKRKPKTSKGFGILSMKTIPKDTTPEFINDIHQLEFLYFVGQKYAFDNSYVIVYMFVSDTSAIEILDRKAIERDFESLNSTLRLTAK